MGEPQEYELRRTAIRMNLQGKVPEDRILARTKWDRLYRALLWISLHLRYGACLPEKRLCQCKISPKASE